MKEQSQYVKTNALNAVNLVAQLEEETFPPVSFLAHINPGIIKMIKGGVMITKIKIYINNMNGNIITNVIVSNIANNLAKSILPKKLQHPLL